MKTLIIAGGTGFLGNVLIDYFSSKVETIYILTRSKKPKVKNVEYLVWDGKTKGDWATALEGADVLINMTANLSIVVTTKRTKT